MGDVATQRESAPIFDAPADDASCARTYWPNTVAYDAIYSAIDAQGLKYRPSRARINHAIDLYDFLRRRHASSGLAAREPVTISSWQAVRDLYDAPEGGWTPEALDARSRSPARWIKLLAAAGLVAYETATDEVGMYTGWTVELLPAPLESLAAGRSSSAGEAAGACGARRRRESRAQRDARRVAPHRRRSGQKGVYRYVEAPCEDEPPRRPPPRAFFSLADFAASRAQPSGGPHRGLLPRAEQEIKTYAHVSRRPGWLGGLSDANPPGPSPDPVAALRDRRGLWHANREPGTAPSPDSVANRHAALAALVASGGRVREGALARLASLVAAGDVRLDVAAALAWWGLFDRPPRLSARAQAELRRCQLLVERAGQLAPPEGQDATAWLLLCDMADYAEAHRRGESWARTRPTSLGYFIRRLRREARRERRGWRQRRQAASAVQSSSRSTLSASSGDK